MRVHLKGHFVPQGSVIECTFTSAKYKKEKLPGIYMFTEIAMATKNTARNLASSKKLQLGFGIRERVIERAVPTILGFPSFTLQTMHQHISNKFPSKRGMLTKFCHCLSQNHGYQRPWLPEMMKINGCTKNLKLRLCTQSLTKCLQ